MNGDGTIVALDAEQLLGVLQAAGVEFVIIGGFALAAHGVVRATKDIDISPAPDHENLARLADALGQLEATIDLGDIDPTGLGFSLDVDGLALGGNLVLITRHGRLDVMQHISGVSGFSQLRANAVEDAVPGLAEPVLFAGYEDLVAMKAAAGRDQDVIDIAALQRARGEGGVR